METAVSKATNCFGKLCAHSTLERICVRFDTERKQNCMPPKLVYNPGEFNLFILFPPSFIYTQQLKKDMNIYVEILEREALPTSEWILKPFLCFAYSTKPTTQERPPLGRPSTCTLPAVRRVTRAVAGIILAVAIMVQERLARRRWAHRRLSHLCLLLRRTFTLLLHRPHIIIHRCPRARILPQHRWIICTTLLQLARTHHLRMHLWD